MKTYLIGLSTDELRALAHQEGEPLYRGSQIAEWIYRHKARIFDDMTNLPPKIRTRMAQQYEVGRSRVVGQQQSRDGTLKLLLEMPDGAMVETVGLPYADRFSCCLSTQVGCPIGCVFCASGLGGLVRNLTAGEIVDQLLTTQEMTPTGTGDVSTCSQGINHATHVTFMGMGEPLLNYASTSRAIQLLNEEVGISLRHITISTIGFPPGIVKLTQEGWPITLAISLHAPVDELRRRLIPGMTKWSIAEVIDASREYIRRTNRRVTFEYCLLEGINDGTVEAQALARLLRGLNCHVNLIRYNSVSSLPFHPSSRVRARAFREILLNAHIQVTQRLPRGADIDAACGQLRRRLERPQPSSDKR